MRQFVIAFFVLALMLGGMSSAAYAVNCYKARETAGNKTGDWFATFGKTGNVKKRILAQRKRDRFKACVEKNLGPGRRIVVN